jgi:hypothetical protein
VIAAIMSLVAGTPESGFFIIPGPRAGGAPTKMEWSTLLQAAGPGTRNAGPSSFQWLSTLPPASESTDHRGRRLGGPPAGPGRSRSRPGCRGGLGSVRSRGGDSDS